MLSKSADGVQRTVSGVLTTIGCRLFTDVTCFVSVHGVPSGQSMEWLMSSCLMTES